MPRTGWFQTCPLVNCWLLGLPWIGHLKAMLVWPLPGTPKQAPPQVFMSNFLPDSWKSFHYTCVISFLTMFILLTYNLLIQFNLILVFLSWKREKCEDSFLSGKEIFVFLQSLVKNWENKQLPLNQHTFHRRIQNHVSVFQLGQTKISVWKIHTFLPTLGKVMRCYDQGQP